MKQGATKRNTRGFTLMELVIVMAVMSIMTMMTVSFTMIVSAWSTWGTNRYQLINSERRGEQFLRTFISTYDNNDYYFTLGLSDGVLQAVSVTDATERHEFRLAETGELEFMTSAGEGYCPLDHITMVRFAVRTNGKNKQLILMRMYYELPDKGVGTRDGKGTYDILVCTRATGATA